MSKVKIGERFVGFNCPPYVIAEIGINHGGKLSTAKEMIIKAVEAGAQAVKFQSFTADKLWLNENNPEINKLHGLFKKLEWNYDDLEKLKRFSDELNIEFLSTPFDENQIEILESIGVNAYKVASGDITHYPLLRQIAQKNKPVLLSTGMSYAFEVRKAINTIKKEGNNKIILLHCVSCYPTNLEDLNLRAITTMNEMFDLPVGFSDHSIGQFASLIAVSLGAVVIEKHFTLNKKAHGPDHQISAEPHELKNMIDQINKIPKILGTGEKVPAQNEEKPRIFSRRSLSTNCEISKGASIDKTMISALRPGTGISPEFYEDILGKTASKQIKENHFVSWKEVA